MWKGEGEPFFASPNFEQSKGRKFQIISVIRVKVPVKEEKCRSSPMWSRRTEEALQLKSRWLRFLFWVKTVNCEQLQILHP